MVESKQSTTRISRQSTHRLKEESHRYSGKEDHHHRHSIKVIDKSPNLVRSKPALKKKKKPMPNRPKPKVTREQLKAVVYSVFSEADEDGNGDLDLNECRTFLRKLLRRTYPEKEWDEEQYKEGFYGIDVDKGGSIDFDELFLHIYANA